MKIRHPKGPSDPCLVGSARWTFVNTNVLAPIEPPAASGRGNGLGTRPKFQLKGC